MQRPRKLISTALNGSLSEHVAKTKTETEQNRTTEKHKIAQRKQSIYETIRESTQLASDNKMISRTNMSILIRAELLLADMHQARLNARSHDAYLEMLLIDSSEDGSN